MKPHANLWKPAKFVMIPWQAWKFNENLWKSVRTNAKHMCNTHFGQCLDVVQIPEITDAAAAQGAVVLRPAPGPLHPLQLQRQVFVVTDWFGTCNWEIKRTDQQSWPLENHTMPYSMQRMFAYFLPAQENVSLHRFLTRLLHVNMRILQKLGMCFLCSIHAVVASLLSICFLAFSCRKPLCEQLLVKRMLAPHTCPLSFHF